MRIDTDRLRELRARKNLSRKELAYKGKISLRQLSRLESKSETRGVPRDGTINRLATALEVEPGVLTGEFPLPEAITTSRPGEGERVQVSALLWPEVRLAYALVKRRYGVNPTTLFNAAPLLFTLLAEGSFLWRREKLKEVREAAEHLNDLGFGHLSFAYAAYKALDGAANEQESIRKCDLFGRDASQDALDLGYDTSVNNPFADYLRELARKIDNPDVIELSDATLAYAALENLPFYKVCKGEVERITGGSRKAAHALEQGYVRISDIPDDLWADDATNQRVRWLEEQLPESARKVFDLDLSTLIDSLKTGGEEADQ